jgi:AAA domain-containing protein
MEREPLSETMSSPAARQINIPRLRALSELALMGRNREMDKLLSLAAAKTPALIHGRSGFGKTRLLLELHNRLAADGKDVLYLQFEQPLHAFLLKIAERLSVECEKTSSVSLRGALWKAFDVKPYIILLDDIGEATPPYYRFFQRVLAVKGNTIIGAAVHEHALGALRHIFWNPQVAVPLRSLSRRNADALLEAAISAFLREVRLPPDFALRVAHAARGNPGRIVEMCILAANPAYRAGDCQIRFGALVMDSLAGRLS